MWACKWTGYFFKLNNLKNGEETQFFIAFDYQEMQKSGETSSAVYQRTTVDGKRVEISTKTNVATGKWISGKGRINGADEEVKRLNAGIITFEHRAREIYNRFVEQGKIVQPLKFMRRF